MDTQLIDSYFDKSVQYRTLSFSAGVCELSSQVVRETHPASSTSITERHLHCVWFDPELRPDKLQTQAGEPIIVIDPGRWNLEAGPDFLDATLSIGKDSAVVRGDIEIHIDPADWAHHGHDTDPAYANIIAHICYKPGKRPESLPSACEQIDIGGPLSRSGSFFADDVDLSAYPYSLPAQPERRCSRHFPSLDPAHQLHVLSCAGHERLRLKTHRMRKLMATKQPDQILYEELMAAFGYKHNRTQFRLLAAAIPLEELRDLSSGNPESAYAILLGASGLLPHAAKADADPESRQFIRGLWDRWWKYQSVCADRMDTPIKWNMSSLRPANHPARRLAAAASLFCKDKQLLELVVEIEKQDNIGIQSLSKLLSQCNAIAYWDNRLALGGDKQPTPTATLGKSRVAAMVVNVLIPFVGALGYDISVLLEDLPRESFNSVTKQMMQSLMGGDYNSTLYSHGLHQQGLIQIFTDHCLDSRHTCSTCRFATALDTKH